MHSPRAVQAAVALVMAVTAEMEAMAAADEDVRLPKVAMAVVADSAGAPARPTQVSHAKTPVMDNHQASRGKPRHRASAMHKHRVSTVNNNARTHAAHA